MYKNLTNIKIKIYLNETHHQTFLNHALKLKTISFYFKFVKQLKGKVIDLQALITT